MIIGVSEILLTIIFIALGCVVVLAGIISMGIIQHHKDVNEMKEFKRKK